MSTRAYLIVVMCLLLARVGQCAGPPNPHPPATPAAVTVSAASYDPGAEQ